jgi:hypothetical protein
LFVAGLLIRLLALPCEGTQDVLVWKTWSYGALNQGVARLYGVGGQPPERGLVRWGERVTTVDYPPVALYELAATGAIYRIFSPAFDNNRFLNAAIKLPGVLAEIALTWLLWRFVARRAGEEAGRWAAVAYWANPAIILAGSVLGYLDALMALPAAAAIAAAASSAPATAGALLAIACLTKAQALFVAPVVALAVWNSGGAQRGRRLAVAFAAVVLVSAVVLTPYLRVGASRNVAVPLLAGAAAFRPRLRPVFLGVSAVFALNLYLFFGFGRGLPLPPRNFTVIDSTVIVAAANCVLFAWHARVFSAESRAATNQSAARENTYPYDRASPAGSG